jgi:hypothetical protein
MQAYVKINSNGEIFETAVVEVPNGLSVKQAITYMKGVMFEEDWCPGTPYAMYMKASIGGSYDYSFVDGDTDLAEQLHISWTM